jgi:hypothetical protein
VSTSDDATAVFLDLFRAHGLTCQLRDGWIIADSGCLMAQARVFTHSQMPTLCSVQLDLDVRIPSDRSMVESCGGFGKTLHAAIADAIQNLANGSFHVIYSALTGQPCSHCEVEIWEIGGKPRRILVGPLVSRGQGQVAGPETPPRAWFPVVAEHIKNSQLDPGLHWIRLYHFECPKADTENEALLDNQGWIDLRSKLASYAWPHTEGYYSVRMFMIVMDAAIS